MGYCNSGNGNSSINASHTRSASEEALEFLKKQSTLVDRLKNEISFDEQEANRLEQEAKGKRKDVEEKKKLLRNLESVIEHNI